MAFETKATVRHIANGNRDQIGQQGRKQWRITEMRCAHPIDCDADQRHKATGYPVAHKLQQHLAAAFKRVQNRIEHGFGLRFVCAGLIDCVTKGKTGMEETARAPSPLDDWKGWTLVIWALALVAFIYIRWAMIQNFSLVDTDDNLRMVQVRDWLNGQGWYDLVQHRMNPPVGGDIHWSRLVDIPLATIIFILTPLFGQIAAETAAIAIAPALPLAVLMLALGAVVRKGLHANAWLLSAVLILSSFIMIRQFMPTRIDHHSWQLTLLAVALAGLSDHHARRGGIIMGVASAASLAIGLEILPYLGIVGILACLKWVFDPAEKPRVGAYGLSLAISIILAFLLFASTANWQMRCDALSPVWMPILAGVGFAVWLFAKKSPAQMRTRFAGLAVIALCAGGVFAYFFPQCISRPEGISDEAYRLWFSNIREVKAIHNQSTGVLLASMGLPLAGIIGAFHMWKTREHWRANGLWFPIALLALISTAMLFWQYRTVGIAQMLAVPGATALGWSIGKALMTASRPARVLGLFATYFLISGLGLSLTTAAIPTEKPTPKGQLISKAFSNCNNQVNIKPIAALPATTILTFVDLGPRLLATTHHRVIAGPYHRNDDQIVDIHHAFTGTPQQARAIAKTHGATLLLICPNVAEGTLHKSHNDKGLYSMLMANNVPGWLIPIALPQGSPYRLWKIAS